MKINKSEVRLFANPKAVITQFLHLPGNNRVTNIIERVAKLSEEETNHLLKQLMVDFGNRHRKIETIFADHFDKINLNYKHLLTSFSSQKKVLLGAFFTKEYSIQSAALFNPSIVAHPDQKNLKEGEQRFVMSLRATGEGHISSIVFQTGIVNATGDIILDKKASCFTPLHKNKNALYSKDFLKTRLPENTGFNTGLLNKLPGTFTADEAMSIFTKEAQSNQSTESLLEKLAQLFDSNYELEPAISLPLSECVIFPNAKSESMGMEDVRFVQFNDKGKTKYYGTYTAYDGRQIKSMLIETDDFSVFTIRALYGAAVSDKGMALLPQKINGKYVMIARQGGEKVSIMYSRDLYRWDEYSTLLVPEYNWEIVQMGNCGSPIKTDKGWLLLTHGVGVMRTYVISAVLLHLEDPSIIIATLEKPLLAADETEREGYVPNVVYTCGFLRHKEQLMIPYAVSDSAIRFASVVLDELLNEMKTKKLHNHEQKL